MFIGCLQSLRRIAIEIERPSKGVPGGREISLRQRLNGLVDIGLAHSLRRLSGRHYLCSYLRDAYLFCRRNNPVLRAGRPVAQMKDRCVIKSRRGRTKIGGETHAEKATGVNGRRGSSGRYSLA